MNSRGNLLHSLEFIYQLGKNSYGGTPGHISNPEVKPVNAESTCGAAHREDRNLPSLKYRTVAQLVE